MLDIETAAQQLGVSVKTIRRLVQEKELPAYRIGRQLRFKPEELDAFLEENRTIPRIKNQPEALPSTQS
jgi:excisionase family DNA binding protein